MRVVGPELGPALRVRHLSCSEGARVKPRHRARELSEQRAHVGKTLVGIGRRGPAQARAPVRRQIRRPIGVPCEVLRPHIRRELRKHLVGDDAPSVLIGKRRRSRPCLLFRRHVAWRAEAVNRPSVALESVEALGARPDLLAMLRQLDGGQVDLLVMWAWEQMTYAEIADALTIPIGTVRSRIHRLKALCTELLAVERVTT